MKIITQAKTTAGLILGAAPFQAQKKVFEKIVRIIFKEPLAQGDFDFLEGRAIKFNLLDMQLSWVTGLEGGKLVLYPDNCDADACISGNVDEFILLATGQEDPDTLFFQRRINIEGSTEISLAVKNVMDSVGPLNLPKPVQTLLLKFLQLSSA